MEHSSYFQMLPKDSIFFSFLSFSEMEFFRRKKNHFEESVGHVLVVLCSHVPDDYEGNFRSRRLKIFFSLKIEHVPDAFSISSHSKEFPSYQIHKFCPKIYWKFWQIFLGITKSVGHVPEKFTGRISTNSILSKNLIKIEQ